MPFTEPTIAALSAKLDGSIVKERQQGGKKLSYIEAWHAIAEANRIFGFDGWERETITLTHLSTEPSIDRNTGEVRAGKFDVCYLAKVEVRVWTGDYWVHRQGCGYGSGQGMNLGDAHESALKEAESDAMKRALMTFGNPFGLALYDKTQADVEKAGAGTGGSSSGSRSAASGQARGQTGQRSAPPGPAPLVPEGQPRRIDTQAPFPTDLKAAHEAVFGAAHIIATVFEQSGASRLKDAAAYFNVPIGADGVIGWDFIGDLAKLQEIHTSLGKLYQRLSAEVGAAGAP